MQFIRKHWALLLALAAQAVFFGAYYHIVLMDDMYISIRYADNLVRGFGLVYNPGEYFEGYSNFLFILLLAFLKLIGFDYYLIAKGLSFVFAGGLLCLAYFFARRHLSGFWSGFFVVWLSLDPPIIASASLGLETSMFLFLSLASFWAYIEDWQIQKIKVWPVLAVLLSLTRSEGVFLVVLILLSKGIFLLLEQKSWKFLIKPFYDPSSIFVLVPYAFYTIWRRWYYGTLLTGPALFKSANSNWVGNPKGLWLDKFFALALFHWYYFVPFILSGVAIWFLWRGHSPLGSLKVSAIFLVLFFIFGTILYSFIFTDYANFYRYRGEIVPWLIFFAVWGLSLLVKSSDSRLRLLVILFLSLIIFFTGFRVYKIHKEITKFSSRNDLYETAGLLLRQVNCNVSHPIILSTHEAGLVPFLSGKYTLDFWLNDRRAAELIARQDLTGWRDYIVSRHPDLFFVAGWSWSRLLLQDFLKKNYNLVWNKPFPFDLAIYRNKNVQCHFSNGDSF